MMPFFFIMHFNFFIDKNWTWYQKITTKCTLSPTYIKLKMYLTHQKYIQLDPYKRIKILNAANTKQK